MRYIVILGLLLLPVNAWAECITSTIVGPDGSVLVCVTCCTAGAQGCVTSCHP